MAHAKTYKEVTTEDFFLLINENGHPSGICEKLPDGRCTEASFALREGNVIGWSGNEVKPTPDPDQKIQLLHVMKPS